MMTFPILVLRGRREDMTGKACSLCKVFILQERIRLEDWTLDLTLLLTVVGHEVRVKGWTDVYL